MARIRLRWIEWIGLFVFLNIQGCTYLDNYWLGKDNTAVPGPLPQIDSRVTWTPCWTVSMGKSAPKQDAYLRLRPAMDGSVIYAASHQGLVKAVNKRTGEVLWSKQQAQKLVSGPAVGSKDLVFSTNHAGIIVLSKQDGHELWHASVSSEVLSLPLLIDDQVIVKTVDGHLYAFNRQTGAKQWVIDHGAPSLILRASSSPVPYGDMAVVGFSDGKLDAVDLATGRVVWQRSIGYASGSSDVERLADISSDPIVRGDVVYLASYQGYMVAMSLKQGQFDWNKPVSTYRNLAIDSKALYMTDAQDILWSMNRSNGHVRWKQPALTARGVTEPVMMGRRLLVGDKTGFLHLLDVKNGEYIARHALGSPITVGPLVSSDRIYVITAQGQLQCFSIKG
ncbi:MAG: outer membrane protein assembly factor BamB [Legionellaceae bacterium]|jgi:outer membrane protein assembly factor BamB|nr:outer membrane protein assembly factor BamB [Legionellaceae bacterium]